VAWHSLGSIALNALVFCRFNSTCVKVVDTNSKMSPFVVLTVQSSVRLHILKGLRESGADAECIEEIKRTASENNPAIATAIAQL
jgi:hypothetical protein